MSAGGHRLSQKSLGKSDEPASPQPLLIGDTPLAPPPAPAPPPTAPPPSISLISTPFDTYAMMNELQKMGFTEVQSKGLVAVLVQICLQQNDRVLVQPRDLNVLELQIKRDIEQISHNQTLLEKSNISQLRDAAKELEKEIEQLKVLLKDEVK
jgi:hypothetical protein